MFVKWRTRRAIRDLKDSDPSIRHSAARRLARLGASEAIEPLLIALISELFDQGQDAMESALLSSGAPRQRIIEAYSKSLFRSNYHENELDKVLGRMVALGASNDQLLSCLVPHLGKTRCNTQILDIAIVNRLASMASDQSIAVLLDALSWSSVAECILSKLVDLNVDRSIIEDALWRRFICETRMNNIYTARLLLTINVPRENLCEHMLQTLINSVSDKHIQSSFGSERLSAYLAFISETCPRSAYAALYCAMTKDPRVEVRTFAFGALTAIGQDAFVSKRIDLEDRAKKAILDKEPRAVTLLTDDQMLLAADLIEAGRDFGVVYHEEEGHMETTYTENWVNLTPGHWDFDVEYVPGPQIMVIDKSAYIEVVGGK